MVDQYLRRSSVTRQRKLSGSQRELRRQDSMTNLNHLQDEINTMLKDSSSPSAYGGRSNEYETAITSHSESVITSKARSDYQATMASMLSAEPEITPILPEPVTKFTARSNYEAMAVSMLSEPAPRNHSF